MNEIVIANIVFVGKQFIQANASSCSIACHLGLHVGCHYEREYK